MLGFAGASVALVAVAAAAFLVGQSPPASPAPALPATVAAPLGAAIDSGAPPAFAPLPGELPRLSAATDATAAGAVAREKEAPPQPTGGPRKTPAPAGTQDSKRDSRPAVPRGNADPVTTASPFDERL